MFFLIPKNVTSERPVALMPTIIQWWDALRAPEVAQCKTNIVLDFMDVRYGGAESTMGWKDSTTMQEENQGAVALNLAKAFERVSSPVVWAWATHFNLPRRFCGCCAASSNTIGWCSSKDVWWSRPRPSRLFSLGQIGVVCSCALCCRTLCVR